MPVLNSNAVAAYLPNFLLSRFRRHSSCFIHRLPLDIHVDHIFIYLQVEDILCLRRVNKAFFLLTHEPIIWKRFLSRLSVPLPPIRPTFRYALEATDFEIEQLVSRAISLEDNWRQAHPKIVFTKALSAHYSVLDLKLLPGGKYLIASVKDADSYRFYIVIFCLDHPKGPHALARFPTQAKAFHLQAKYMKYRGKQVIMIAYVRRSFIGGGPMNQDPNDYSTRTRLDPPHPLKNELCCVQISLESLEAVASPQIMPGGRQYANIAKSQEGPFFTVTSMEAERELDTISLFDMDGAPYASLVEQPNTVVIINLNDQTETRLVCQPHHLLGSHPHGIRAVRNLPNQKELFVIRTVAVAPRFLLHVLELYDMPLNIGGKTEAYPRAEYELLSGPNRWVSAFHISDYGIPTSHEDNYHLRHDYHPPPPISVYMETNLPRGIRHVIIWPSVRETPATSTRRPLKSYYYALGHVVPQTTHECPPFRPYVLPGAYRSLIYTVNDSDRTDTPSLVNLRRYVNPEYQEKGYPIPRVVKSSHIMRRKHPPLPVNTYCSFDLDSEMRQLYEEDGIAAITWDEGIGRVCLASGDNDWIDILDFSHVVQPDARFEQWKRSQEFISHERYDNITPLS